MDENLLGYLLNALDPDTQREVEAYLRDHPEARPRLELLRKALEPLAADRAEEEPPPELAVRTLGRVAEHVCRDLPAVPVSAAARALGHARPFWRRADVLVAAALLVTALGVGIPWVVEAQHRAMVTECKANLEKFYVALKRYGMTHGLDLPNIDAAKLPPPRKVAGLVVPVLCDAGVLKADDVSVGCPANGPGKACRWTLQELLDMEPGQFDHVKPQLMPCYAYSLGHLDDSGKVVGQRFEPSQDALVPVMADRPPKDPSKGNSPNHGGKGQNVLFRDGSVKFLPARVVDPQSSDDIYLNHEKKVKAGRGPDDAVLGSSADTP